MTIISIKNLRAEQDRLAETHDVAAIKKAIKTRKTVPVSQRLITTRKVKNEIVRFNIGDQVFRIYCSDGFQTRIILELIDPSNSNLDTALVIGTCAEIIKRNDKFLFTKYGNERESYPLGLTDSQVAELAEFLGFNLRQENHYSFSAASVNNSPLQLQLKEWAVANKRLAKALNKGNYSTNIFGEGYVFL